MRRKMMSLILVGTLTGTMMGSVCAYASDETTSSAADSTSSSTETVIGVAISSSTDSFGSQVKKMIDETARVLGVSVNYCDHGNTPSLVEEAPQMLIDAGCQGIVMVDADDTAMQTALKNCDDSKVYLAQAISSISPDSSLYAEAGKSAYYIGAVDAAANLSTESGAESVASTVESTASSQTSSVTTGTTTGTAGTTGTADGTDAATNGTTAVGTTTVGSYAGSASSIYQAHADGEFVEPMYAFLMVYNAVKGNASGFEGKIQNIAFPEIGTDDPSGYQTYFVENLPYSDDEIKALAGESMKDLAASAAKLSVEDAKSRAGSS